MSHTIHEADALGAALAAVGADPEGIASALARFADAFDDPETACNTAADMLDCAQADALAGLADAFDEHTAADIAPALTCREADALTGLLALMHRHRAAQAWFDAHAEADEEGDEHYGCRANQAIDPADMYSCPGCWTRPA